MLFKPISNYSKKRHAAFIYNVVFNSAFSLFVVIILFTSFLVQPIHQAYANELGSEDEPVDEVKVKDKQAVQQPVSDEELFTENEETVLIDEANTDSETITLNDDIAEQDDVSVNPDNETLDTTELTDNDTDLDNQNSTSPGPGLGENNEASTTPVTDSDSSDQTSSSTPEGIDSDDDLDESDTDNQDSKSTTTLEEIEPVVPVQAQSLTTDDNYYQFSKKSCVSIGDGTFHCSLSQETGIDLNAVVYSELGENKNMEIFLRTSEGEVKQITSNDYEDTSPNYNAESMQVVWQRQIDDRYQIIKYDISEEEESQLTFSRTNNMEPKVSEQGIVWQMWDGSDWEIMYFDGKYTDQLTDNLTQDVAPAIDDGYVLWSVLGGSEQEAKVYSLASGEILNINGYEGGMIANPRFVLVYDTVFDNGDVVTQGFDPVTGLSAPIAAKPADNPVNIPNTDSTGETRALIQNKSSHEDDFNPDGTKNVTGSSTPGFANGSTSTSSVSDSLDLRGAKDNIVLPSPDEDNLENLNSSTTEKIVEEFELTDYDLILVPPTENVVVNTATTTGS